MILLAPIGPSVSAKVTGVTVVGKISVITTNGVVPFYLAYSLEDKDILVNLSWNSLYAQYGESVFFIRYKILREILSSSD